MIYILLCRITIGLGWGGVVTGSDGLTAAPSTSPTGWMGSPTVKTMTRIVSRYVLVYIQIK